MSSTMGGDGPREGGDGPKRPRVDRSNDPPDNPAHDTVVHVGGKWLTPIAAMRAGTTFRSLLELQLPPEEQFLGSLITTGSRTFLVGGTGCGKTLLGLAMAGGMASGAGFLHWRSARPVRVLYIDGEMSLRGFQARGRDMLRRMAGQVLDPDPLDCLHYVSWQNAGQLGLGAFEPLNKEEGRTFVQSLCDTLKPDVVIFDNIQALLTGDMKEEASWADTWPLVAWLTGSGIAQLWIDHTGHDRSRQYGTSTKAWRFDSVGIMTAVPREDCAPPETAFTLSFDEPGKARNRSPDTWEDHETRTIRLREDVWTVESAGGKPERKVPPSRAVFHEALVAAIFRDGIAPGVTTKDAWDAQCVRLGLIDETGPNRRGPLRRAQAELIAARWIAIDGDRVMDLRHRY